AHRIRELRVIEHVEELDAELEHTFARAADAAGMRKGHIEIGLAGPLKDSDAGVAESGAIADHGQRAERVGVDIAGSAAETAETSSGATRGGDVGVSLSGSHLGTRVDIGERGAAASADDAAAARVVHVERLAVLHGGDAGEGPTGG